VARVAEDQTAWVLKTLSPEGASLRRFPLAPGLHVVGSSPEAGVILNESGVSRRHAEIEVLPDGGAVVTDLGSKNGTTVGGKKVRKAAVCGFTVLGFGSVQALLQPADPAREQVLLTPPDGWKTGAAAQVPEPPSTQGLHPLERLAESLGEVAPPLLDGLATSEEAAAELVHRWISTLPLGRAEILRSTPGGEVVVAAASTSDRVPGDVSGLEVAGPAGWLIRLRVPSAAPLGPLTPLLRLALELLASREGRRVPGRRVDRIGPRRADAAEEAAPPAGLGAEMTRIYRRAGKVGRGEVPMLILGESGAGKEVLARWVHARSRRAAGPFLAVNCAALPRELLEAELFGIERGVATGVEARPGILERASGGTVFLDEIGDMAAETQAKVLRVLENTSLYRVGGRQPVSVDVRFLAATNRDLGVMVEEGSFRRDLYHRLAAMEVKLPPLRERREEIPSLAARFFHRELEKNGLTSPGITRAALGALVRHSWPGNVRELQNEVSRAVLLLELGEPLDLHHLSERLRGSRDGGPPAVEALTLDEAVRRAEREAFTLALAAAEGDAGRAMELLGVSRTTWYRKLKELGIAAD
jgi:DNA-binding NtrC family response regulator